MPRTSHVSHKLTIFLIKEGIRDFPSALKQPDSLIRIPVRNDLEFEGVLYIEASHPAAPSWLSFIRPHLENTVNLNAFKRSSVSAVLFIKQDVRIYALTFGYGRSLLDPTSYELDFGLRSVLNRVDAAKLRSIDTKTYEDLVLSTRKQTSRDSNLGTFSLDRMRDLLRCVVGTPSDPSFASLVAGADSLTIQSDLDFEGLGDKCEDCLAAYHDTRYRNAFGWIDHLREVRDPHTRDDLNEALVASLKRMHPEGPYLAPSGIVAWEKISKFGFTGRVNALEFRDLDLVYYLRDVLGDKRDEITLEKLRQHQVRIKYADSDNWVNEWSVYSCLVSEVLLRGETYALMDERWFHIDTAFVNEVSREVNAIPRPLRMLPDAEIDELEEDYNVRVGNEADFISLDQKFVSTSQSSRFEVCDLFSTHRQLIHVKKKNRSATLSHLFAQGVVSAIALLEDNSVRRKTREYLREKRGFVSLLPADGINPTEFEIAYIVIAKQRGSSPLRLPFFSQVFLMQQARILRRLNFRVALQIVDEVTRS